MQLVKKIKGYLTKTGDFLPEWEVEEREGVLICGFPVSHADNVCAIYPTMRIRVKNALIFTYSIELQELGICIECLERYGQLKKVWGIICRTPVEAYFECSFSNLSCCKWARLVMRTPYADWLTSYEIVKLIKMNAVPCMIEFLEKLKDWKKLTKIADRIACELNQLRSKPLVRRKDGIFVRYTCP